MKARYITLTAIAVALFASGLSAQPVALPTAYPAGTTANHVRNWQAMRPGLTEATIENGAAKEVRQVTQYYDGLGRTVQTVVKQGSLPTGGVPADLVKPYIYDARGREQYRYLPFAGTTGNNDGSFKLDPYVQQQAFMQGQYGPQGETFFYGKTEFEASPASRPLKTMSSGNSWVGHPATVGGTAGRGISIKYGTNTVADSVRLWNVVDGAIGSFASFASTGFYPAGRLSKSITIDQHGKQVVTFRDHGGQVVLKKIQNLAVGDNGTGSGHYGWLCTYYIYDELGNQHCVLQPKAVEILAAGGWILDNGILAELALRYGYDQRNRLIAKKMPGAGAVYMVYDGRDRLVLAQDANGRNLGKWEYTQYDALNRPVATGLWTTGQTAEQLWTQGDPLAGMTSGTEELTRVFYDGYNWLGNYGAIGISGTFNPLHNGYLMEATNNDWPYPQPPVQSNAVKGMATGSRIKIIGSANTYLYTVTLYDDKGRAVQVQSTNASGGVDISTTQYAWAGQPLINVLGHRKGGDGLQASTVVTKLGYDDLWRLVKTEKKMANSLVNGGAMPAAFTVTAQLKYDALGRLDKKELAPATGGMSAAPPNGAALETLDFDYNIRGWLLGVNRDYINETNNNNYFGYELAYDKANNIIPGQNYAAPQYNGNVSGSTWRAKGDGEKRKYDFTYDAANRLASADFNQYTNNSFSKSAGIDFGVSNLTYDANGNILGMAQKGWKVGGPPNQLGAGSTFIDQLKYSYLPNSNKLQQVTDTANNNASKLGDFKYDAAAKTGTDYSYDSSGNLALDNNKKISGIQYNHLNLPSTVTVTGKGSIDYVYDATGNKLKKIVRETGKPDKVTEYINGFVYQDGELQFAPQEEGRIRLAKQYYLSGDSAWTLQYDYFLTDHLGNVRTVLTAQKDTARYAASFETTVRAKETALFTNIAQTAYPISLIQNPTYPADNTTSPNGQTSKLDGINKQLGATLALKVMAGDKVDIGVRAWVPKAATAPDGKKITTTQLLSGLIGALTNGASGLSGGKASPTELQTAGSPMLTGIDSFLNSHNDLVYPNPPRAYLNWILFDEQFKFVPSGSGFIRVGYYEDLKLQTLAKEGLPVAKSGYLFVYLSNEVAAGGEAINVFFDNLTVQHYTGPLMEENVFYPYGLQMAGISSKAMGRLRNKYTFNGNEEQKAEFSDGSGLETMDFNARMYDPQLGRFWQQDPLAETMKRWSPYAFGFDNPIRFADPSGMQPGDSIPNSADPGTLTVDPPNVSVETNANGNEVGGLQEVTVTGHRKKPKSGWGKFMDFMHGALDVVGTIDPFGIADAVNGAFYLLEGDLKNAAICVVAILPFGDLAKGLKYTDEVVEVVGDVVKYGDEVEEVAEATLKYGDEAEQVIAKQVDEISEHGNKLNNKPAEGYTLRDKQSGDVKKYGETTRGEDKFGAGKQRRYSKKFLKKNNAYYKKEASGTKKEMHAWQHKNIIDYKNANGGMRPGLNKSDY
jgi:RHS repeat-associated protein